MRNDTNEDQSRTATPAQALKMGADYLVVGRPILLAANPREVVEKILAEMNQQGSKG